MPLSVRLRAWAELTRISNLPTVVSNVIVGAGFAACSPAALGRPGAAGLLDGARTFAFAVALLAVSLIYLGGMILNDVCDVAVDRAQRPGRPIPSGRVTLVSARRAAVAALLVGPLLLLICNLTAALLGAALSLLVVLYNLIHARWGISVFVMGLCRGTVYPVACAAVAPVPQMAYVAAAAGVLLAVYTAMFSMVARGEAGGRLIRWPALVIPVWLLPFTVMAYLASTVQPRPRAWILCAFLAYLLWTARAAYLVYARPPRVVPAVVSWLAGICLVDVFLLTLLAQPWLALVAGGCFLVAVAGHRRIIGT